MESCNLYWLVDQDRPSCDTIQCLELWCGDDTVHEDSLLIGWPYEALINSRTTGMRFTMKAYANDNE